MMDKEKIEEIKRKKKILEDAKVQLKKEFFGIDDVIDKFVASIESWYIFPELRTRPLIVNLWGITGVGKTALVRKFVHLIHKEAEYAEITKSDSDIYYLAGVFDEAGFSYDTHGVVLFDEFQQLKTKNEKNEEIEMSDVVDLWTFLSDGTFPVPYDMKVRIENAILDIRNDGQIDLDSKSKKKKSKLPTYYATRVYKLLHQFDPSVKYENVITYTAEDALKMLENLYDKSEMYANKVFSKMLLIISGNLDEAFGFAKDVDEADIDADYMNEVSKEITMTDIKAALWTRFRPEQISRLGNIHIIFPVLSKSAYGKLIDYNVHQIVKNYRDSLGINYTIGDSLIEAIYRNGVFPSQGVRPVFSTISLFLENSLSYFSSKLYDSGKNFYTVIFDKDTNTVKLEGEDLEYKVDNTLDSIRDNVSEDEVVLTSVHEAGHAVLEALLFNVAPRQLTNRSANSSVGGFTMVHAKDTGSKEQLLDKVKVLLGGKAAEEFVFGKSTSTYGPSEDLKEATSIVMRYNNMYALNGKVGVYDGEYFLAQTLERDSEVESILALQYDEALKLVSKNRKFLVDVAEELVKNSKVEQDRFIEIAKANGVNVSKSPSANTVLTKNYSDLFKKFKDKRFFLPKI